MPIISRFYGIKIAIFFNDHDPPHFHAAYGGKEIMVNIQNGDIMGGNIGNRAISLVEEWRVLHIDELMINWHNRNKGIKLTPIKGLV